MTLASEPKNVDTSKCSSEWKELLNENKEKGAPIKKRQRDHKPNIPIIKYIR